jgi:hypothetical protein
MQEHQIGGNGIDVCRRSPAVGHSFDIEHVMENIA